MQSNEDGKMGSVIAIGYWNTVKMCAEFVPFSEPFSSGSENGTKTYL